MAYVLGVISLRGMFENSWPGDIEESLMVRERETVFVRIEPVVVRALGDGLPVDLGPVDPMAARLALVEDVDHVLARNVRWKVREAGTVSSRPFVVSREDVAEIGVGDVPEFDLTRHPSASFFFPVN